MAKIKIMTTITVINEAGEHPPGSPVSIEEAEGLALIDRFGGEVINAKPKATDKEGGGASS